MHCIWRIIAAGDIVSIRTRPFGRVMHRDRTQQLNIIPQFQSAPGLSAG